MAVTGRARGPGGRAGGAWEHAGPARERRVRVQRAPWEHVSSRGTALGGRSGELLGAGRRRPTHSLGKRASWGPEGPQ